MDREKAYREAVIMENKQVYENVFKMKLQISIPARAGQFCMIRGWDREPLLSRPISICDRDENSLTLLYIVVGRGTQMLSNLKAGQNAFVLAPLGNGFEIENFKKAALISGGIGIAPMLLLAKTLKARGIKVDLYAGFREMEYFTREFKDYTDSIHIASENGLCGSRGNVLNIFSNQDYDMIYSCGPNKMLQAIKKNLGEQYADKLQLSLESHMACGIGACLGCTVNTNSGMKRVCADGPVFYAKEVIFDA